MKKNKIISKTVKPYVGVLTMASIISLACIGGLQKNLFLQKKSQEFQPKIIIGADIVLTTVIAYFFLVSVLQVYKGANKFAINTARKYIEQKISKNPDYQQFCNVLFNQNALRRIATLISNELSDEEQNVVVDIVNSIELAHKESQIAGAMSRIIDLIEKHASVHPEFTNMVYSALARESYDIYVKQKQAANAKLLNQRKK